MTRYLFLDDLLRIAERATGTRGEVRDVGLLESAAARPRTAVFGEDACPTLTQGRRAPAFARADPRAVDGNKRLGWTATAVFLGISDHRVAATDDEVYDFVIAVADGSLDDVAKIAERLAGWT